MKLFDLIKKSDTEYCVNFGDSIYANRLNASVYLTKCNDIQVVITYDAQWLQEMKFKHLSNVRKYFQLYGKYHLEDAEAIWHKISYYKIGICEEIYKRNKEFLLSDPFFYENMIKKEE